jgi:hypothetical protein
MTLSRYAVPVLLLALSSLSLGSTVAQDKTANIEPSANDAQRVNVRDFGAVGDGVTDETEAFQKALDSLGAVGGVVYVPQGQYRFSGSLNVPQGATLRGPWNSVTAHNGCRDKGLPKPTDDGATFLVTGNAGNEDADAFITLNTNSVLQGVVLYWPEQKDNDVPTPYPWAVKMRGKNPAILDVELLNPYNGIDASRNERALIRNIHGQPLRRGIFVDRIYDIGRIENVHFNPWWSMKPKLFEWQQANGEAFIFKRTDWHYVLNTFCFGYAVGYEFGGSADGVCNGNFLGIGADSCHTSVLIEQSAIFGVLITNGEFVAMHGENPTQVVASKTNSGSVRFANCAFWGPCEQIARISGSDRGMIGFSDCEFVQWDRGNKGKAAIQIDGGSVMIRGCNFQENKKQISISENTKRVVVTDNFVKGKVRIDSNCANARIEGNLGD